MKCPFRLWPPKYSFFCRRENNGSRIKISPPFFIYYLFVIVDFTAGPEPYKPGLLLKVHVLSLYGPYVAYKIGKLNRPGEYRSGIGYFTTSLHGKFQKKSKFLVLSLQNQKY
jgi:hypothetical protein